MKYMNGKIKDTFHFDYIMDLHAIDASVKPYIEKDFNTVNKGMLNKVCIEGSCLKEIKQYMITGELQFEFDFYRHMINDIYTFSVKLIIHYFKNEKQYYFERNPFDYNPDRVYNGNIYGLLQINGIVPIDRMIKDFISDVNDKIDVYQYEKKREENPIQAGIKFDCNSKDFLRRISIEENKMKNQIKSITVNQKKRIITVVFKDGDVQMSKCSDKDVFDETVGVALCIASHFAGSKTKFKNFVAEHTKEKKK